MKYLLCFTIAVLIAIATVRADDVPRYPIYAWIKTITGDKVEIKGTLNQNELIFYDFELDWHEIA